MPQLENGSFYLYCVFPQAYFFQPYGSCQVHAFLFNKALYIYKINKEHKQTLMRTQNQLFFYWLKPLPYLLLFLFSISSFGGYLQTQQVQVDSLINLLPNMPDDSSKVAAFRKIVRSYLRIDCNYSAGMFYSEPIEVDLF